MRQTGLNIAQFGLMTHIAAAHDDTIGALAERCGLDQSTLSRNLRLLEREGLVEIVTAEKDLRRRAVWLTEKGARGGSRDVSLRERIRRSPPIIRPADVKRIAAADGGARRIGREVAIAIGIRNYIRPSHLHNASD